MSKSDEIRSAIKQVAGEVEHSDQIKYMKPALELFISTAQAHIELAEKINVERFTEIMAKYQEDNVDNVKQILLCDYAKAIVDELIGKI